MNVIKSILTNKKLISFFALTGTASCYFYHKHHYEKELYERMLYLLENDVKLSGVYLQQRQPFGFLGYISWLIPYHQSLKIVDKKTGKVRHVGLGSVGSLTSQFVFHDKEKYHYLNMFETSIPIECWVDYKRKTGHFPENIDVDELNRITITSEENNEIDEDDRLPVYSTTFGSITKDIDGKTTISTCKTAALWAIKEEESRRLVEN